MGPHSSHESSFGQLASGVSNTERRPSTWRLRALLAAMLVILLVPTATIGTMVWRNAMGTPWSTNAVGNDSQAATLAAPSSIEAERGEEVSFSVTLSSVHPFPLGSIIAIQGLPEGATLSSGRPNGKTEWTLRPDEIGDCACFYPRRQAVAPI